MPLLTEAARVRGLRGSIIGAASGRGEDSLATGEDREATLTKGMGGRRMTRGTVLVAVASPMTWAAAIETDTLGAEGSSRRGSRHRVRGVRWWGRCRTPCWQRKGGSIWARKLLQDGPDPICQGGNVRRNGGGRIRSTEVLQENLS